MDGIEEQRMFLEGTRHQNYRQTDRQIDGEDEKKWVEVPLQPCSTESYSK